MYRLFWVNEGPPQGASYNLLIFYMDEVDLRDNCKEMLLFLVSFEMDI